MSETTDPRPMLLRTVAQTGRIVAGVPTDRYAAATPCRDYDVRALLGHLLAVVQRVTHVAGGGDPFDLPQVITGVADGEWAAQYRQAAGQLAAAWAEDAVLDRVLTLPLGTMPGRAAAAAYTVEVTTHGWDLATATGQCAALTPEIGGVALALARRFIPAEPRGDDVPFDPPVAAAPDGDHYAQLAGWMGRTASAGPA